VFRLVFKIAERNENLRADSNISVTLCHVALTVAVFRGLTAERRTLCLAWNHFTECWVFMVSVVFRGRLDDWADCGGTAG